MQSDRERRKRRQWTEDEKRDLLERWKTSGLTAKEFAAGEGVARHNLFRWRRTGGPRPRKPRSAVTFAPLKVLSLAGGVGEASERVAGLVLELELPSGARARVYGGADMQAAGALLSAVFGRVAC